MFEKDDMLMNEGAAGAAQYEEAYGYRPPNPIYPPNSVNVALPRKLGQAPV